jgi:hypothetical protein
MSLNTQSTTANITTVNTDNINARNESFITVGNDTTFNDIVTLGSFLKFTTPELSCLQHGPIVDVFYDNSVQEINFRPYFQDQKTVVKDTFSYLSSSWTAVPTVSITPPIINSITHALGISSASAPNTIGTIIGDTPWRIRSNNLTNLYLLGTDPNGLFIHIPASDPSTKTYCIYKTMPMNGGPANNTGFYYSVNFTPVGLTGSQYYFFGLGNNGGVFNCDGSNLSTACTDYMGLIIDTSVYGNLNLLLTAKVTSTIYFHDTGISAPTSSNVNFVMYWDTDNTILQFLITINSGSPLIVPFSTFAPPNPTSPLTYSPIIIGGNPGGSVSNSLFVKNIWLEAYNFY